MPTDPLYEALYPFHQWARIAAVCAFVLAAASFVVLALSRRLSRRWWVGMGVLGLCLLAVAFGARSRGASYDLYPYAICFAHPTLGCEADEALVIVAQQRVAALGIVLLAGTALGLVATAIALFTWRRSAAWRQRPPVRIFLLPLAIFVAGFGVFSMANSVARWIETAYLADITRAGDSLGQIPLFEAIVGAIFGGIVLVAGLGLAIRFSAPHRERPDIVLPSQVE